MEMEMDIRRTEMVMEMDTLQMEMVYLMWIFLILNLLIELNMMKYRIFIIKFNLVINTNSFNY